MVVSIVALGIIVGVFTCGIVADICKTNRIMKKIRKIYEGV